MLKSLITLSQSAAVKATSTTRTALYSSVPDSGISQEIPFYEMVEMFYDRAANIVEDKMVEEMPGKASEADKRSQINGILKVIKPCNHILNFSFPLKRDTGVYSFLFLIANALSQKL